MKHPKFVAKLLHMKTVILFFVSTLLPALLTAQSIVNPDFETSAGWLTERLEQSEYLVPSPDGAGQSLHLRAPFADKESGFAYQEPAAPDAIITQYQLSAKVRTRNVKGTGAYLYAYGKGKRNYLGYARTTPIVGDEEWTEVSLRFIADEEMDSIRIGCYLGGEGEAWFDDVHLERTGTSEEKMSRAARKYLKEFFKVVEPQALDTEKIDWAKLKIMAQKIAAGAKTPADVHAAISYVLPRINTHSFFMKPQLATRMAGTNLKEGEIDPNVEFATGHLINGAIAYLTVPEFGSGHVPTQRAYADSLQRLIASMDREETIGWVVDLRGNTGGNCWPMLAGVGPLIGEGICGYFMGRDGSNAQPWSYVDGKSVMNDFPITTTINYKLKRPASRIAVLTGPRTMSSGEVTTVAFKGLENVRSFGAPTGGYSTTNSSISLSDGGLVLLTVSVYGDRNKNGYGAEIAPDVLAEDALEEAVGWLKGK